MVYRNQGDDLPDTSICHSGQLMSAAPQTSRSDFPSDSSPNPKPTYANADGKALPAFKAYRRDDQHSYLAGSFPAQEWLRAGRPALALIVSGQHDQQIEQLAMEHRVPVVHAPKQVQRLADKHSCQVVLVVSKQTQQLTARSNHLVLHEVADFGNLGTILRCALGFHLAQIAIIGQAADHWHPKVLRASMGAAAKLQIERFADLTCYRDQHPDQRCYPFMLGGEQQLHQLRFDQPVSLIFGNESRGLPTHVQSLGQSVRIAHQATIDSLNLANSVSIALHHWYTQQMPTHD